VTCDWTIARSGFVPGEVIIINGSIQNESKRTVTKSTICLIMVTKELTSQNMHSFKIVSCSVKISILLK